jgi:nucleoside-diphosphate-sugar epimerase
MHRSAGPNIILTGGAGYLGSQVKVRLENSGFNVFSLDKNDSVNPIDFTKMDLLKQLELPRQYSLIHLAFPLPGRMRRNQFRSSIETMNENLLSVLTPDRTLVISSTAVYSLLGKDVVEVKPWEIYGELKLETEAVFCEKFSNVTIFRPGTLLEAARESTMMRFLKQLRSSKLKFIPGSGNFTHPFTHTGDLVSAIESWSLNPESPTGIFDLLAKDSMTFSQILERDEGSERALVIRLPIWLLRMIGWDAIPLLGISKWHFRALTYNLNIATQNSYSQNFRSYESIMNEL